MLLFLVWSRCCMQKLYLIKIRSINLFVECMSKHWKKKKGNPEHSLLNIVHDVSMNKKVKVLQS